MASRRRTRRPTARRPKAASGRPSSHSPASASSRLAVTELVPHKLQQQLLEAISSCVEDGRSPEDVGQTSLKVFLELTEATAASLYLQDEHTHQMRCFASIGDVDTARVRRWDQLVPRVVRAGCLVQENDVVAFPLKRLKTLAGVLVVQGLPTKHRPTGEVVQLLDVVAARLAIGLNHARLAQKYAQKIVRIRQLEQVSDILNSSLDEMEAIGKALETAVALVQGSAGSLRLFRSEEEQQALELTVGAEAELLRKLRLKIGPGLAEDPGRTGRALVINAATDERLVRQLDPETGFRIRSILAVPVRARGRTLGSLEAVNKQEGQSFSRWDVEEFTSLANQIGIALDNAKLFHDYHGQIRRLRKLEEISSVLNSTLNQAEIRKRAIEAATDLMDAEAGSLLLVDEVAGELYFEVALGEKGEGVREIRLKLGQGIAGTVAQTGEPVIVNDVQHDPRFSHTADRKSGFVTRNMVCVPVKAKDKLLGVLQAINKKEQGTFRQPDLQDFVSLGNQVGIAIENANLYEEINRLFEGFISASVLAIESRDPSTSGHSGRVATLTCGLAETVDRLDHGPYAEVRFDHEQMKEIRYAAVLHDFGKVGVRENVLVKAQKLFPGDLALLKSRFDFIKRTLEVQALRRKVEVLLSGDREATVDLLKDIDRELARRIAETDGMLEFLLVSSVPTERPTMELDRLNAIASMTYESFDGLKPYINPDEVIALSIPKGSLTAQERLEIQTHVTHTYRFLSTIPWTRRLKNIPEIAYGHHEKLDGSGYPRKAPGQAISVQTRMMTISDIYDALTASDRPYKAAVPPAIALGVLEDEVKQGKVDAELLRIFIEAKVYQKVRPA
jgi:HD-GYP domain-containing protein (c-di-GMP phosphodiesterase class II)